MSNHARRLLAGAVSRHFIEQLESRRLLTMSIVYVDSSAIGAGDGTTWADAYPSLANALNDSNPASGDTIEIHVAAGTYTPAWPQGVSPVSTFSLENDVAIMGGYGGGMSDSPDTRSAKNVTILSGQFDSSTNAAHVVTGSETDASAILDGVTITGGVAVPAFPNFSTQGGGIYIANGTPTIQNCIITGNTAYSGGGVFVTGLNSMSFTNCLFTDNSATNDQGGAIEDEQSSGSPLQLFNCTFSGNSAASGGGGAVGALSGITPLYATNTIFWGDTDASGNPSEISSSMYFSGGGANDVQTDGGFDPEFVSSTDFHLQAVSQAIDSGNNSFVPFGLSTDLDFNLRIYNGTVDLGAYEYQPPPPTMMYVDQLSSGETQDGSSWDDAYHNLQDALQAANSGTIIDVANETFYPTSTGDPNATFQLKDGVTLSGGLNGVIGESNGTQPDLQVGNTTLSGAIISNPSANNSGYSYHVVTSSGTDSTAELNNFNIVEGSASGTGTHADGGGIYNHDGSPTISGCSFIRNYAASGGGAIFSDGASSLTLNACAYDLNSTPGNGGAVYSSSNLTISGNVFGQASGYGNTAANGGAAYLAAGTANVSNTVINYNTATSHGGGIQDLAGADFFNVSFTQNSADVGAAINLDHAAVTASYCTFSNNNNSTGAIYASDSASFICASCTFDHNSGQIGAVYADHSNVTATNCSFANNLSNNAGDGGAISFSTAGVLQLQNCIFTSNSATLGGAIYFGGTSMTAVNCLFTSNTATGAGGAFPGYGGAIYLTKAASFTNSTFYGNSAATGGAIWDYATPTITNCIFWNDSAATSSEITNGTVTYSDVSGGYTGSHNINIDPRFVDPTNGDFRLLFNSPAIDAGNDSAIAGTNVDLAGDPRISGTHVDMGAYEGGIVSFLVTSSNFTTNAPAPRLNFTFNSDVDTTTIDPTDVTIYVVNSNGSLGSSVTATSRSYNSTTKTISFGLPISTADGNYRASLATNVVSDTSGDPNTASTPYNFFVFAGDANRDRAVNTLDFNALATHFGHAGDFVQGDFNYSGTVDSNDFDLLAGKFGSTLAAPAMMVQPANATSIAAQTSSLFSSSKINDESMNDLLA